MQYQDPTTPQVCHATQCCESQKLACLVHCVALYCWRTAASNCCHRSISSNGIYWLHSRI